MQFAGVSGTCSMGTLYDLDDNGEFDIGELKSSLADAYADNRQALVANLDEDQIKNKPLVSALPANGFRQIGTYPGNSSSRVHVFMRGLTPVRARKTSKKAA